MKKILWFYLALFGILIFILYYKRQEISESEELSDIDGVLSGVENFVIGGVNQIMGRFDEIYQKWGAARNLDWKLIKAVAKRESNENPNAVGDNGKAIGLMQLWSFHWGPYSREQMFDPDHNIERGSLFLSQVVNQYGVWMGLEAYNNGARNLEMGNPNGVDYANAVFADYQSMLA